MLPAWASSAAPTPEPHQGFASSATVALVFFVLGVLVRGLERALQVVVADKKQTMAREKLYHCGVSCPSFRSLAPPRPRKRSFRVGARSGEGRAEKIEPSEAKQSGSRNLIGFACKKSFSIVFFSLTSDNNLFSRHLSPSPDSAPQMAQRHVEHAGDDPVYAGIEPGGAGV